MKKETLKEAAKKYVEQITTIEFGKPHNAPHRVKTFIEGAKYQAERMYSEEEVVELLTQRSKHFGTSVKPFDKLLLKQDLEWFEKFKK
jgi:hypothetical protein